MTASQNALLEDMEQVCARLPKSAVVADDILLADEAALLANKEDEVQDDEEQKDEILTGISSRRNELSATGGRFGRIILTLIDDFLLVWPIDTCLFTGIFLTITLVWVYFWTFDITRQQLLIAPTPSTITALDGTASPSSSDDDLTVMQQLQTLNANLTHVLAQTRQLLQLREDILQEMQAAQEKLGQLQELLIA
jgi:hypothetical protein